MAARYWCPPLVLISLLLLAPRVVSSVCGTGTAEECKVATSMPGVEMVGEGFDVVHMRGTGIWVVDTRSWQLPDGGCTLCLNDQLGDKRQRLPQTVKHWHSPTDCRRHPSGQTFNSAEEVSASVSSGLDSSWSSNLDVANKDMSAVVSAAGSLSQQTEFARQKASSDRYSFSRLSFSCRLYKARLGHQPPLHPHLEQLLHNLPSTGGTSEADLLYSSFLRTVGTHYVVAVDLGGAYTDLTALRTCEMALNGQTLDEVKDCLKSEVLMKMTGNVDSDSKRQRCSQLRSRMEGKLTFHQTYSDRFTEVTGGSPGNMDNPFNPSSPGGSSAYSSWLSSLPAHPGVLHRTLEPLHLLLPSNDSRRDLLKAAISRHLLQAGEKARAMVNECPGVGTKPCPAGGQPDPSRPCSCRCQKQTGLNTDCCPFQRRLGTLQVVVKSAHDLPGDWFSQADPYVCVRVGSAGPCKTTDYKGATTYVVWNNNNPVWNQILHLGQVSLAPGDAELTVELWDSDVIWHDLRGKCRVRLSAGHSDHTCNVDYGSLTFSITLTCGPRLGGDLCQDYMP